MINFRTYTAKELQQFIQADHPQRMHAVAELCTRTLNGHLVDAADADANLETAVAEANMEGYNDGCRDERDLIVERISDIIAFDFRDKIDADVMLELIDKIKRNCPRIEE